MKIKCEHPNIIIHPEARFNFARCSHVWLNDVLLSVDDEQRYNVALNRSAIHAILRPYLRYRSHKFVYAEDWYKRKVDEQVEYRSTPYVTPDDVDKFYIVCKDGSKHPLFLVVPCGKCTLCRKRKVQEWQARCVAESLYSKYAPLFVTLTYCDKTSPWSYLFRDPYKPYDGLQIRDVQLFLKRLRINLERNGFENNLRYVVCGEYGHNTKRVHYHLIIWNFPPITEYLGFCPYDETLGKFLVWNRDKYDHRYLQSHDQVTLTKSYKFYDKLTPSERTYVATSQIIEDSWEHGRVDVKPCLDCSGSYVLKYMKKEPEIPYYTTSEKSKWDPKTNSYLEVKVRRKCNPTFFRQSLGKTIHGNCGGIGVDYACEYCSEFRNNYDSLFKAVISLNKLPGYSKDNNAVYNGIVGSYFNNKWFPTRSRLVPQRFRETFESLCTCFHEASWAYGVLSDKDQEKYLLEYNFIKEAFQRVRSRFPIIRDNYIKDFSGCPVSLEDPITFLGYVEDIKYLSDLIFSDEHLDRVLSSKEQLQVFDITCKRKSMLASYMESLPDFTEQYIKDLAAAEREKIAKQTEKEFF